MYFFFVLLYIFGILLLILSSLLKPNIFGQKNELAGDGWDFLNSFFFFLSPSFSFLLVTTWSEVREVMFFVYKTCKGIVIIGIGSYGV